MPATFISFASLVPYNGVNHYRLTSFTQIENSPAYIRLVSEDVACSISEELRLHQHRKGTFSANLIRYVLFLRYTSAQCCKLLLKEFHLPSFSLLRKIKQGENDVMRSTNMLFESNAISKDVTLMFETMYLKKNDDYVGGKLVGANEYGQLYRSNFCFMIVGLQESVSFMP